MWTGGSSMPSCANERRCLAWSTPRETQAGAAQRCDTVGRRVDSVVHFGPLGEGGRKREERPSVRCCVPSALRKIVAECTTCAKVAPGARG
jgi:hypothetical protein